MRTSRLLVLTLALALALGALGALGGCKAADPTDGADSSNGGGAAPSDGEAAGDGLVALEPETDAEKAALATAESEEGRKWASGDITNGVPVEGDATLVGYGLTMHDATMQYQAKVLGDKAVGYFGPDADMLITGSYGGWDTFVEPATDRQRKAYEAAKAEVAKVNPGAMTGGIEYFVFYFPADSSGAYRMVGVYAKQSAGAFAMGGTEVR